MRYESTRYSEIDVPIEILDAARKIHSWMAENGTYSWELLDICSRGHAYELRSYKNMMIQQHNGKYEK